MSGLREWLRNLPDRWSESRARKREREANAAYGRRASDPNAPTTPQRHGAPKGKGGWGVGGGGV